MRIYGYAMFISKTKVYLVHNHKKAYKECYTTEHRTAVGNTLAHL